MGDSTPICRCRVLYLGSAVPRQSKDGLQGIQEPLRSLYPAEGAIGAKGIDSWLSVWSNGILLENVDENLKQITRFFPIESLHYCAAVRQVLIPERGSSNTEPKFLPLDSPFARMPRAHHPPIFAAILRRTTGIKVLECHVFICKREAAANALVRCCFHAYADNSYARQLETGSSVSASVSVAGTMKSSKSNRDSAIVGLSYNNNHNSNSNNNNGQQQQMQGGSVIGQQQPSLMRSRAGSTTTLGSVGRFTNGNSEVGGHERGGGSNGSNVVGYQSVKNFYGSSADLNVGLDDGDDSHFNGDENHKVWNGSQDNIDSYAFESPYEVFSGNVSTLGRPMRARQISSSIAVPPPPAMEEKSKKKNSSKSSGSQSLSGTLIRPNPITPTTLQRPSIYPGAPASVIYGPSYPNYRQYHTISHREMHHAQPGIPHSFSHSQGGGGGGIVGGIHHHPFHHPQIMQNPNAIPLQVPVMMPQQFATLQPSRSAKKKKKDKKHNGIPVGMPIVPPIYAYHHQHPGQPPPPPPQSIIAPPPHHIIDQRPLAMSSRRLAASVGNGLDDSGNSGADSPSGTGIYRRKGHLNERAFSYSIRQEHRSRSHGSLASLQFNPTDMKKEREIAQMVAGLDLNDVDDPQFDSSTLQRKQQANNPNDYYQNHHHHHHQHHHQQHHHQQQLQHQAIYGNTNQSGGVYGSEIKGPSIYGKPRR